MKEESQLFELMTKMYSEMQEGFSRVDNEMQGGFKTLNEKVDNLENRIVKVENRIVKVENRIVKMEYDNHRNFTALFDGYKQNAEILERVEKEVSKHEEVILRRIK